MLQLLFLGSLFSSLLTIYTLLFKKDAVRSYADFLLSFVVLFFAWNVILYLLLHYKLMIEVPYFFKTAAPFAFAIPALSYLYTRAVLFNEKSFQFKDLIHYVPFILVFVNYLPFYLLPMNEKMEVVNQILKNMDLSYTYQAGIIPEKITNGLRIVQLMIYLIFQWRLIFKYKKNNTVLQFENQIKEILKWLKIFTWFCTSYVVAFLIIIILFVLNNSLFYHTGFINQLPLIFYSVSFFIVSSYLLVHPIIMDGLPFIKYKEIETNILTEEHSKVPFFESDYSVQIEKIKQYFDIEKPYLNKQLTLSQVAVALDLPIREVSYIINNYYNNRFTDYVNNHRIQYVIDKMSSAYLDNYTIESLALEAGFISKSGFYKSFKKLYNTTPSEYFNRQKTI